MYSRVSGQCLYTIRNSTHYQQGQVTLVVFCHLKVVQRSTCLDLVSLAGLYHSMTEYPAPGKKWIKTQSSFPIVMHVLVLTEVCKHNNSCYRLWLVYSQSVLHHSQLGKHKANQLDDLKTVEVIWDTSFLYMDIIKEFLK